MELTKWPETEMEYYKEIEGLGGFIWMINHEISHGNIKNAKGVRKDIKDAIKIQNRLLEEIVEKFGVVVPEGRGLLQPVDDLPVLPKGKEYYLNWYSRMKKEEAEQWFEKTICFACPMSNKDRQNNDYICKYNVNEKMVDNCPRICWAWACSSSTDFKDEDGFFKYIEKNYGEDAVLKIKKHVESLEEQALTTK
jgi:hypothetical protein